MMPKPGSQLPMPEMVFDIPKVLEDIGVLRKAEVLSDFEHLYEKGRPNPSGFLIKFSPMKNALMQLEAETGLPLFDLYKRTQTGVRQETLRASHYTQQGRKALKGTNLESRKRIYRVLEEKGLSEELSYPEVIRAVRTNTELAAKFDKLTQKEWEALGLNLVFL